MILCLGIATDFGLRASWPFSPFLCIYFVASLCFSVFMVSWFGASVVSYLHRSSDSSASLSSQPVSLFLYLLCIFLGVRSFSRRWFHIRPNNQLLEPKFASNIRFIAFLSTKQRFRVRGRFGFGFQILSNTFKCFQMLPNASKCVQMLQSVWNCFRMFQIASECFRSLQNASKCFQRRPNASNCFRMFEIASECFQMLPNASRCFQMLPNASECTRMLPLFQPKV